MALSIANAGGSPPMPIQGVAVKAAPAATLPAQVASPVAPSDTEVRQAVTRLSASAANSTANLQFSVDSDTGKTLVRVVDKETGDVIRQIPSEEVLELAKSLDKMKGMLLQGKA